MQNIQHLVHHILSQQSLVQYTTVVKLGPWLENLTGTIYGDVLEHAEIPSYLISEWKNESINTIW